MSKQKECKSTPKLDVKELTDGLGAQEELSMPMTPKAKVVKSSSSCSPEEHLDLSTEEGLRKIIECPICLEVPLPPIYLCCKGHIVCSSCQLRTDYCPLCRSRYGDTRSFVAESIVEKCTLRCKHVEQGCAMICKGSEMPEHLRNCDFRPVKCTDCAGKWIDFNAYHSHLTDFHQINGTENEDGFVVYNMNLIRAVNPGERFCWPQYYFKAYDKTFLLRLYATHYFICAYVCLLGSKEDCDKYRIEIELHLPSDDSMVHSWTGKSSHFRDDASVEIFRKGRGLVTPFETMLEVASISSELAEWMYHVKIKEIPVAPPTAPMPSPIPSAVSDPIATVVETAVNNLVSAAVDENNNASYRSPVNNSYTVSAPAAAGSSMHPPTMHQLATSMATSSNFGLLNSASLFASAYSNIGMTNRGNSTMNSFMCSDWDDSDSTDYDPY